MLTIFMAKHFGVGIDVRQEHRDVPASALLRSPGGLSHWDSFRGLAGGVLFSGEGITSTVYLR